MIDTVAYRRKLSDLVQEVHLLRQLCERSNIDWNAHLSDASILERGYPHIIERLAVLWPEAPAADYLYDLIFNQRPGAKGFPAAALDELMGLYLLLKSQGVVAQAARGPRTVFDAVQSEPTRPVARPVAAASGNVYEYGERLRRPAEASIQSLLERVGT